MRSRLAAITTMCVLQWFAATNLAEAQRQKGKMGGGAGFAWLADPDVNHGSTFAVGGFFGSRFNDNVSVEAGLYYMGSNRVFAANGVPVDQTRDIPAFRFETTRFHADGVVVFNIGRRQPFHPFVLFGGGVQRVDDKRTDFTFEITPPEPPPGTPVPEVTLDETRYVPNAIVGGGAEIYFMYNLAVRAEFRIWIPKEWEQHTHTFFFSASYYF